MNCEKCGKTTSDGKKLCLSCIELETDPKVHQESLVLDDVVSKTDILTREEKILVLIGITGAIFLVGTTLMYMIF